MGASSTCFLPSSATSAGTAWSSARKIGDPAVIKPRLYLDLDRFAAAEGKAFLVEGRGREPPGHATTGWEAEIPLLTDLLRAREGLPLR